MSNTIQNILCWVEIDKKTLIHNIKTLRKTVAQNTLLCLPVKGNAYGHGLIECASIVSKTNADWLGVNALFEAEKIRANGIKMPILIMGYILQKHLIDAIALDCRCVIYNKETALKLNLAAEKLKKKARVHIKIETGNNRQGIAINELIDFVDYTKKFRNIIVEGISTHFANIEDVEITKAAQFIQSGAKKGGALAGYPAYQLENFKQAISLLSEHGCNPPIIHASNSAATLLFPETHFSMVRPGIATYGMWPSLDTKIHAQEKHPGIALKPVLSWKTRIAQIKNVAKGAYIGYGCTYKTLRPTKLAILPIGYYDGFDRLLGNRGVVLIRGKKAPVHGTVCMNITMADVTEIPEARVEDIAVLIGRDGKNEITAEDLAAELGTINYEITTRINENIPRIIV